jgi:hypothetical protein
MQHIEIQTVHFSFMTVELKRVNRAKRHPVMVLLYAPVHENNR